MNRSGVLAALMSIVLVSCDKLGVKLIDPEVDPNPERAVTITTRLEDAGLAEALGWEAGVPGATISYHRVGDEFVVHTTETDANGDLRFENMLPGQYRFAAYRRLSTEETGPFDGLMRAFGDGVTVVVEPPQEVSLSLRADRAGSVMISEVQYPGRYEGPESNFPTYQWFSYFEMYNNADTTVYLDGMLWGLGFLYNADGVVSCESSSQYRNDPNGIWAQFIHQFPGSGSDYPLLPGQAAVVAVDGVDHSVVHPALHDLSIADFELEGTADADNPDVPNMPEVGPSRAYWMEHGVTLECRNGCFLAQATNPESLVRQRLPYLGGAYEWALIPMESIVDVITTDIWNPSYDQPSAPCATTVQRSLDRLEKPLSDVYHDVSISMQRRVLRMGSGGSPLLQDVGVSFSDFELAPRSPGWIGN